MSMRGLSDAAGNITDRYAYDAYGMVLHQTGATANPYRYRGEQYDADLSAYYLRARSYQPATGRFLTTDPVEGTEIEPASLHRYLYANANPAFYWDPTGRFSVTEMEITAVIIGVLVGMESDVDYVAYFSNRDKGPDDELQDCKFTVYVRRPTGHGAGDSIVNINAVGGGPVGHAFFALTDYDNKLTIGSFSAAEAGDFTPGQHNWGTLLVNFAWGVPGKYHEDEINKYHEKLEFSVSRRQYRLAYYTLDFYKTRYLHYNLFTNNCTDLVLNVAERIGAGVPYSDGPLSNPQMLADTIYFFNQLSEPEKALIMDMSRWGLFKSAP